MWSSGTRSIWVQDVAAVSARKCGPSCARSPGRRQKEYVGGTIGVVVIVALMTVWCSALVDLRVSAAGDAVSVAPERRSGDPGRRAQMSRRSGTSSTPTRGTRRRSSRRSLERAQGVRQGGAFDEILIPEENVVEIVKGEKRTLEAQVLPGLHPGAHGADGRDLAPRQGHAEGHRLRGRRRQADADLGRGGRADDCSRSRKARSSRSPKILFEEGENVRVIERPVRELQRASSTR